MCDAVDDSPIGEILSGEKLTVDVARTIILAPANNLSGSVGLVCSVYVLLCGCKVCNAVFLVFCVLLRLSCATNFPTAICCPVGNSEVVRSICLSPTRNEDRFRS